MAAKKSKSRFSDLVKFVPEEIEDEPIIRKNQGGIQTKTLSAYTERQAPPTRQYAEPVKQYTEPVKQYVEPKETYVEPIKEEVNDVPEIDDIPEIPDSYDIPEIDTEIPEEFLYEEEPQKESIAEESYEEDYFDSRNLAEEINVEDEIETNEELNEEINNTESEEENMVYNPNLEAKREFNASPKNIEETIILGNTTIKGDIITDTGIQIYGAVLGNIESGGRVQLVGKVEGDISGKSVYVTNTSQTGNITAQQEVHIKEGCQINGDITAEKVFLKGSVEGNINASGQVDFEAGSEIRGNVTAHSFNIKPGAKINGSINTN